jgi:hypothetical protein
MACAIVLAAFWLAGVVCVWAICHVGKRGDRY